MSKTIISCQGTNCAFNQRLRAGVRVCQVLSKRYCVSVRSRALRYAGNSFVVVLPSVIRSFCLGSASSYRFRRVRFGPSVFSAVVLSGSKVFPVALLRTMLFSSRFCCQLVSSRAVSGRLRGLVSLRASSSDLFATTGLGITLVSLVLRVLSRARLMRRHRRARPRLRGDCMTCALGCVRARCTAGVLRRSVTRRLRVSIHCLDGLFGDCVNIALSGCVGVCHVGHSVRLVRSAGLALARVTLRIKFGSSRRCSGIFKDIVGTAPSRCEGAFLVGWLVEGPRFCS